MYYILYILVMNTNQGLYIGIWISFTKKILFWNNKRCTVNNQFIKSISKKYKKTGENKYNDKNKKKRKSNGDSPQQERDHSLKNHIPSLWLCFKEWLKLPIAKLQLFLIFSFFMVFNLKMFLFCSYFLWNILAC